MVGPVCSFIIPGKPVPKARTTQKSKWSPRAKRSLAYQDKVGWCAKAAKLPQISGDVELTIKICQGSRGQADLSNIIKAIEDGLQYAGVLENDRQVLRYGMGTGFWLGWKEEQVIVELREVVADGNA